MKTSKFYNLYLGIAMLLLQACSNHSFDSNKWKEKRVDWWITDFREKMVKDIIESDTLIGKTRLQVVFLLGDPDTKDTTELEYLIREKYSNNIDPDYVSYLRIQFDNTGRSVRCIVGK